LVYLFGVVLDFLFVFSCFAASGSVLLSNGSDIVG